MKPIQLLKHFVIQVSQKVPLRTILIVPFVLQIVITVGLTGYLSFRNGQKTVEELVNQLQSEVGDRIYQKLTDYLETPSAVNDINVDVLRLGLLDASNSEGLDHYLWNQIRQFEHLTYIAIATQSGNYVGIGRRPDNELVLGVLDPSIDTITRTWSLGNQGERALVKETLPNYAPRQRSWYQAAIAAGRPVWSNIYIAFDGTKALLLPHSRPFYDAEGNLAGVVTSTLKPATISQFLDTLKVGQTGETFVVDRDGLLIATSTNESITRRTNREYEERILATYSRDFLVRSTAQYLDTRFGDIRRIHETVRLQPRIGNRKYFIQVQPFRDRWGLDWLVVVVIPQTDFTAQIRANNRTTILLCLVALAGAIAIGVMTSRWITKPILQLSQAADALSKGNWDQQVAVRGSDELSTLATAFNRMSWQLKQSHVYLEQKVQERTEALRQSEEKFAVAFRSSPEPIAISSLDDGRIIEVNESYLKRSGYSREEVIGKNARELNLWVQSEKASEVVRLLNDQGFIHNLEVDYRKKSGEIGTVLLSAEVIELNGQPCVLYVNSDISDRKQFEAALQQAKDAAEAANLAKSEFLANMSHELRTPLNAILGFTQVMAIDRHTTPQQRENLNIISRSGEHLLALINDILDMSKIEAGRLTFNERSFDLHSLLHTLADMLELRATSKGLQFILEWDSHLPQYVKTDENKLRQVLINLLGNAIKFTQDGGVILQVRQASQTPVLLEFEIEDTGPGISPQELPTLFEPFVQTEAGRQSNQGTGLGLAISQKFVQLMGGTITVNSILGQGSVFKFAIPINLADTVDLSSPQIVRRVVSLLPDQPRYRILIVDDAQTNRLLLVQLLEPLGFDLREAGNGQEAIALWQHWHPHLIWMDMRMPVVDGYEATQQIRLLERAQNDAAQHDREKDGTLSPTKILALTASAFDDERDLVLAAGCDDLVRKPFRPGIILEKLTAHLGVDYSYEESRYEESRREANQVPSDNAYLAQPPDMTALPIPAAALQGMSSTWIAALHQAAVSGDDSCAAELIAQIPPTHHELAIALIQLINNFRLDIISDLTQEH